MNQLFIFPGGICIWFIITHLDDGLEEKCAFFNRCGLDQLVVSWWFGILGVHPSNNPFHNGILGIQITKYQLMVNSSFGLRLGPGGLDSWAYEKDSL